ncbi:transferase [Perkinsus sp. BL_2016]|nr:transferase [Perkinsus sp. BL_2016]
MDAKTRKKLRVSWAHHIVAFANAVIITCMSLHYILGLKTENYRVGTHTYYPEVARILSVSAGYFIWDVQICFKYYSIYGAAFALHGVMALIALVISFRPYMMNLMSYYMLVEISTIFLHSNWFLIKLGYKNTIYFKISHGLLLTSYFIIRILVAPYFVYETIVQTLDPNNTTAIWAKTIYCSNVVFLALLSQFWFWKMTYSTFFAPLDAKKKIKTN